MLWGKKRDRTTIIPHFSDTHSNSTVGLCPPTGIRLDDGGRYMPSRSQGAIWERYEDYWLKVKDLKEKLDAECLVAFTGDGSDDNKHSDYQLSTKNEAVMVDNGVNTLRPALDVADEFFHVRGTEAHVGGAGHLEELVAREAGATRDEETGNYSWWYWPVERHGRRGFFAHHPYSNTTRPWTRGNGANRTAAMIVENHGRRDEPCPDFAGFGHVHHLEDSGMNHRVRVLYNYGWQLTPVFGHRIGFTNRFEPVGGLIFVIEPDGRWDVRVEDYWPDEKEYWT